MPDRVALRGLRARGHHGVFDFERREGQDFVVDAVLYLDTAPAGRHRGLSFLTAPELREAVVALDAAGFDVHFHAVGDRAVRDALDAVAAEAAKGTNTANCWMRVAAK